MAIAGKEIELIDVQPLNVELPVIVLREFTVTDERPVQLLNVELPEIVVKAGNDIDVSPLQPLNTLDPASVARDVSVTVLSDVQPWNALLAMEVTAGKLMVVIFVQPCNADAPIVVRFDADMDVIPVWFRYRFAAKFTTFKPEYVLIVIAPAGVPDRIESRRQVPFPKSVKLYTSAISI